MVRNIILLSFLGLLASCAMNDIRKGETKPVVRDVSPDARQGDEIRKRVVVLPFLNLSPYSSPSAADIARTTLTRQLHRSGEVIVLSLAQLTEDVSKFQVEDGYDLKQVLPLARKVGAHGVIIGRIKELRTKKVGDSVGVFRDVKAQVKTLVDLQMVSVKSASKMVHENRTATIEESVTRVAKYSFTDKELQDNPVLIQRVVMAAFDKMVPIIVRALRKLNWEGRVALVRGERIFLNAGRLSGIQVGDILRITEGREEVYDPETGSYIGKIRGRLKGTVEVVSYFGKDGAVSIIHSGSGFNQNDIVEFY